MQEYESQTSSEAKAVKDLDRFEMILQAFEYEKGDFIYFRLHVFIRNQFMKI